MATKLDLLVSNPEKFDFNQVDELLKSLSEKQIIQAKSDLCDELEEKLHTDYFQCCKDLRHGILLYWYENRSK